MTIWPTTETPPGWTVTVRCASERHAVDARPIVMVARCVGDGRSGPPWQFDLRGRSEWAALDRGRREPGAELRAPGRWLEEPPVRMAYRLRCPTCRADLPVADEFELYDLMNARAAERKHSDTLQRIDAARKEARNRTM